MKKVTACVAFVPGAAFSTLMASFAMEAPTMPYKINANRIVK
jgi:hypothetical protein